MARAADLSATDPTPDAQTFRLQMEGFAMAVLYSVCFGWIHLQSGRPLLDTTTLAAFFGGLVVIPLFVALPLAWLRRMLFGVLRRQRSVASFLPLASFAFYGLQAILVWIATREAHAWVFPPVPML